MQNLTSAGVQYCPDCGQQLETLWDYPSNEIWCLQCGNRFYRTLSRRLNAESDAGRRLLILDSDCARRDGITGRFANNGYCVTPVCHPRQALEAASFRHFDLAILSADWPGYETAALIKKLRWQLGEIKFLVYGVPEHDLATRELANSDVLCVRISATESQDMESALEHIVEELLDKKRSQVDGRRFDFAHSH